MIIATLWVLEQITWIYIILLQPCHVQKVSPQLQKTCETEIAILHLQLNIPTENIFFLVRASLSAQLEAFLGL